MAKKYLVTYGENNPVWTKECTTVAEVLKFVRRCPRVGDVVYVKEVASG